jgi:hypothetical protein
MVGVLGRATASAWLLPFINLSGLKGNFMPFSSLCIECTRRLRDAIFCPYCRASACCWDCYIRHFATQHTHSQPFRLDSESRAGSADSNDPKQNPDKADSRSSGNGGDCRRSEQSLSESADLSQSE